MCVTTSCVKCVCAKRCITICMHARAYLGSGHAQTLREQWIWYEMALSEREAVLRCKRPQGPGCGPARNEVTPGFARKMKALRIKDRSRRACCVCLASRACTTRTSSLLLRAARASRACDYGESLLPMAARATRRAVFTGSVAR